jgi:hypothetical protein
MIILPVFVCGAASSLLPAIADRRTFGRFSAETPPRRGKIESSAHLGAMPALSRPGNSNMKDMRCG